MPHGIGSSQVTGNSRCSGILEAQTFPSHFPGIYHLWFSIEHFCCGYITATGKTPQAASDHSELVKRCGSPVDALQELLYGNPDLQDGAGPHVLGLPEE